MSTPQRRRGGPVHVADTVHHVHSRSRPSWLFAAPKKSRTRKECSAFLKLFCFTKKKKETPLIELNPLLLEHAELYQRQHNCDEAGCKTVRINVAGQIYETQLKTLRRYPTTLLGRSETRDKYWDEERKEYFFDRHRPSFDAILNFYQNGGRLRRPMEAPEDVFLEEIKFFQLCDDVIDNYKEEEGYLCDNTPAMPEGSCLRFFWRLFAGSNTSCVGRCMALWSMFVTLLSVVIICVETLPKYRHKGCQDGVIIDQTINSDLNAFFLAETLCVLWFCIELTMRFASDPNRIQFFTKVPNIIDAVTLFPYPGTVIEWQHHRQCLGDDIAKYIVLFRLLKFIRVMRLFKLCRYIQGLRILLITVRKSTTELVLFLCFIAAAVVVFAAGIYFAESGVHGPRFTSTPEAFWWAVVSLTTVGYGDYVPSSTSGKLVGTICICTGILVVAFPVPVLVANFTKYYRHQTGKILSG